MNPRTAELIRMNGFKFNLLFGFVSLFVAPFLSGMNLRAPEFVIGLFGLFMYFGEAWSFYYKTKLTRARIVYERTDGNPRATITPLPGLGCFVTYGFFIRLVFRILFLIIALSGFGLISPGGDDNVSGVTMTIMIIGVLFELFVLMMSWIETRVDKDEEEKEPMKKEEEWRVKNFRMLKDSNLPYKELFADFVLFVSAMMFTHLFWTMSNNEMMGSLDVQKIEGTSAFGAFLLILFTNGILCLFMLVPVRLAYWIGESISVIDQKQKWRLRLSFLFAAISMTMPVFAHWFRTYFL